MDKEPKSCGTSIRIRLASPAVIRSWSAGELTALEELGRGDSGPGSLGRMRHIELACPVAHPLLLTSNRSALPALLGWSLRVTKAVLAGATWVVVRDGAGGCAVGAPIGRRRLRAATRSSCGEFEAATGPEALRRLLIQLDLPALSQSLRQQSLAPAGPSALARLRRRLQVAEALLASGARPEWMMLEALPVLPASLMKPRREPRAGADNATPLALYTAVVGVNRRLAGLLRNTDPPTPEKDLAATRTALQSAVNALFGMATARPPGACDAPPPGSLVGRLRNRQSDIPDGSVALPALTGRGVIVPDPSLRPGECGIPVEMALELYQPQLYRHYVSTGLSPWSQQAALRAIRRRDRDTWNSLAAVTAAHPVILFPRSPRQRTAVRAYLPRLVADAAIHLHPTVCAGLAAVSDMGAAVVRVPLFPATVAEVRERLQGPHPISPGSGLPVAMLQPEAILGLHLLTANPPDGAAPAPRLLRGSDEARLALEFGSAAPRDPALLKVGAETVSTTVGRALFSGVVPPGIPLELLARPMTRPRLRQLVAEITQRLGTGAARRFVDDAAELGLWHATRTGISVGIDDFPALLDRPAILAEARGRLASLDERYREGIVLRSERAHLATDIWLKAVESLDGRTIPTLSAAADSPGGCSLLPMIEANLGLGMRAIRRLIGISVVPFPGESRPDVLVATNLRDGHAPGDYFATAAAARREAIEEQARRDSRDRLLRSLARAARDLRVVEEDCGDSEGVTVPKIANGDHPITPLWDRIAGRVLLEDLRDPDSGEVIVAAGAAAEAHHEARVQDTGAGEARVRSALSCRSAGGVCARCCGHDPALGRFVRVGDAVGLAAAHAIAAPSAGLAVRHVRFMGNSRLDPGKTSYSFRADVSIRFYGVETRRRSDGELVVVNRSGAMAVTSTRENWWAVVEEADNHEITHRLSPPCQAAFPVIYGSILRAGDGGTVPAGTVVAAWEAHVILSPCAGVVRREEQAGQTGFTETFDPVTGRAEIRSADKPVPAALVVFDETTGTSRRIPIPTGGRLTVAEGARVLPGDVLARWQTIPARSRVELPRLEDLFEARPPREPAVLSQISGRVALDRLSGGWCVVRVTSPDGLIKEHRLPAWRLAPWLDGGDVRAGDALSIGTPDIRDLLPIVGERAVAERILREARFVFSLHAETLREVHLEIIVRLMTGFVEVDLPGDTRLARGQLVQRAVFEEANRRVTASQRLPAVCRPVVLGVSQAARLLERPLASALRGDAQALTETALRGDVAPLEGMAARHALGRPILRGEDPP